MRSFVSRSGTKSAPALVVLLPLLLLLRNSAPPNNACCCSAAGIFESFGRRIARTRTKGSSRWSATAPVPTRAIYKADTNNNMAKKKTTNDEDKAAGSVLRELKETVRRQASEIENLKKQLLNKSKQQQQKVGGAGHGGHGAGAGDKSPEELSEYLHLPFYKVASTRVGWLGLFLVSLSMTALIMNGFEDTLEKQLELAYFVPLLAGHGGNTGGQAVGTVLSAFSAGALTVKDAPKIIPKEAASGKKMFL